MARRLQIEEEEEEEEMARDLRLEEGQLLQRRGDGEQEEAVKALAEVKQEGRRASRQLLRTREEPPARDAKHLVTPALLSEISLLARRGICALVLRILARRTSTVKVTKLSQFTFLL